MERKGEMTKALLGQKFKELVVKKSFDKITIKMITDEAGVIRPTFYNYFRDKYEVMEWLLWEDVFSSATELVKMNMARSALEMIFKKIAVDKEYYARVFEASGNWCRRLCVKTMAIRLPCITRVWKQKNI